MSTHEALAAASLATSASGYAALAAERLLQQHPDLVERFGEGAFTRWKDHLSRLIRDLAVALASENLPSFLRQASWIKTSFVARGSAVGDLEASLQCLRDVLLNELGPAVSAAPARYLDSALETLRQPTTDTGATEDTEKGLQADTPCGQLAARYLERLLQGRCAEARAIVLDAVSGGALRIEDAYAAVLLVAQREIGRMWHENEVSVAEEHMVTATSRAVMSQLLSLAAVAPARSLTVLTAAVQGNAHDIAIHALADLFEIDGWAVINLGGDVPAEDLAAVARDFSVDLVALSVTLDAHREGVKATIDAIRRARPAAVLVGGPAFQGPERLWRSVGADGYAASVTDATRIGAALVQRTS